MRLSLSTNWCNRRIESGERIAEKALQLGFDELELGYHTTQQQVAGFRRMLGSIPVGSVHAFCPVPISAPQGYPELYQLASFDEEARKMALLQVRRNIAFAADIGASTLVLHAGRVACASWFESWYRRRREKRGVKLLSVFRIQLEAIVPDLERAGVTLALENLPYFEGFPNRYELGQILGWNLGDRIRGWYDTGHARVCEAMGWEKPIGLSDGESLRAYAGLHLNDVMDKTDDHLAPSFGKVDFAALKPLAEAVRHIVFEPHPGVSEADLKTGIAHIRSVWQVRK